MRSVKMVQTVQTVQTERMEQTVQTELAVLMVHQEHIFIHRLTPPNATRLHALRDRGAKLLVIHETIEGRIAQQGAEISPAAMQERLRQYLALQGADAVAVTDLKGRSWGVPGTALRHSADVADYYPPTYERAAGLRVANHVVSKQVFLDWDFHIQSFHGLPVTLVGHNPELGVEAAENWEALKRLFAEHRFYIHTANPSYEDGFNMAMCEAMAAGLPVITNAHPRTPITDGVDGFVARSPDEARRAAEEAEAIAIAEAKASATAKCRPLWCRPTSTHS